MKTKTSVMDKIKNAIIKWLGLDYVAKKLDDLSEDLHNTDWSEHIDYRDLEREMNYNNFDIRASDVAEEFSEEEIAYNLDYSAIASELDSYDVASCIEMSDLARNIDKGEVAANINLDDDIANGLEKYFEGDNMNDFARIVAEKIADRDGAIISEEVDSQGINISTDAVQSMIDTAIQQFADSLEVMVSAKLNINK